MANGDPFRGVPRGAGILPGTQRAAPQAGARTLSDFIGNVNERKRGGASLIGMDDPRRSRFRDVQEAGLPTTSTELGDVAFAPEFMGGTNFGSVEDLIESRVPGAISTIRQGTDEAIRLSEQGRAEGGGALEPFLDFRALEERNALLGLSGAEAQQEAIGGIPVSQFDRALQDRQRRTLARQQQATGDLGGGSSIAELSQLGAQQQTQQIQQRLNQLSPLVQASRGVASSLSGIDEQELQRQAQLEQAAGIQAGNVRLGTTAPVVGAIQNRGELAGLRAISSANQRGQIAGQLARVIPQGIQAFQNFQTNRRVGQDLSTAFAQNPGVF